MRGSFVGWAAFGGLSVFALATALPRALSIVPVDNPAVWQAFSVQQFFVIALGTLACLRRPSAEAFVAGSGTLLVSILMLQADLADALPSLDIPAHLLGGALAGILVLPNKKTNKPINVHFVIAPQLAALALGLGNEILEALSDHYLSETVMFLSPLDTTLDLLFNQSGAGLLSFFLLRKAKKVRLLH